MRVTSRGSFLRSSPRSHDIPRLGERIGRSLDIRTRQASAFVNIIATFGSLAPPKEAHPYRAFYVIK
jgi:hypothetical protein